MQLGGGWLLLLAPLGVQRIQALGGLGREGPTSQRDGFCLKLSKIYLFSSGPDPPDPQNRPKMTGTDGPGPPNKQPNGRTANSKYKMSSKARQLIILQTEKPKLF